LACFVSANSPSPLGHASLFRPVIVVINPNPIFIFSNLTLRLAELGEGGSFVLVCIP
jgi:hypothetical protein